jgi:hypothetical protein
MTVQLEARNATLQDFARLLQDQHTRKLDVVAPASAIHARDGHLVLTGTDVEITEDGVTPTEGTYLPTEICDAGLADKLHISVAYIRRLRAERPDLWDANINGWLHGRVRNRGGERTVVAAPDPRSFLIRLFRGDGDGSGIARAFLSDRYGIVDNLDVLMAALDGVKRAGVDVDIDGCDLSERRMHVRVVAPQVAAYAHELLKGYRSPFDGRNVGGGWTPERVADASRREGQAVAAGDESVVFAGFVISNSETGGGAFSLTPRLVVQVCNNGLQIAADTLREVHLGGRMEAGVVRWSADTERRALDLVTAKTRDAVSTFLDVDYVTAKVRELEDKAGAPVTNPAKTIGLVAKRLSFTDAQAATILDHFIRGGQMTAGGVMQAVTSAAQMIPNPDTANDMEAAALRVLELAAER